MSLRDRLFRGVTTSSDASSSSAAAAAAVSSQQTNEIATTAQNITIAASYLKYCCWRQCFIVPFYADRTYGVPCRVCCATQYCRCSCRTYMQYNVVGDEYVHFCCSEQCFRAPRIPSASIVCNICNSIGYCRCDCITYSSIRFLDRSRARTLEKSHTPS